MVIHFTINTVRMLAVLQKQNMQTVLTHKLVHLRR